MSYQRPDDEYAPSPDVAHRWASRPLRGARQRFLGDVFATCPTPLPHRQLNDLQRRLNTEQDWPS